MGGVSDVSVLMYTVRYERAYRHVARCNVGSPVHGSVLNALTSLGELGVVHWHPLDSLPRERPVTLMLVKHFLQPATLNRLIRINVLTFTCGRSIRPTRLKVEGDSCKVSVGDDATIFLSGFNLHTKNLIPVKTNRAQITVGIKVGWQAPTLTSVRCLRVLSRVNVAVSHFRRE